MKILDTIKENIGAAPVPGETSAETNKKDINIEEPEKSKEATASDAEEDPKDEPKDEPKEDSKETPKEDPEVNGDWDDLRRAAEEADEYSSKIISQILDDGEDYVEPAQPKKEARNKMQTLKFYEKIADKIHDYDANGVMAPELRAWIVDAIEDDEVLSETFVKAVLPRVLTKNPKLTPEIKNVIKQVADNRPVPFKLLFVNAKDSSDKKEYETFAEARESIKKEVELYGVDPKQVFKVRYRRVDADGNVGEIAPPNQVEAYVENFDGDRNALRQALHLPKKDKKASGGPNPKGPKNNGNKKGGSAATENSDSSSGANSASN